MTVDPSTEAQLRLAAIIATSDDAIIGNDLRGTITSWNRAAEGMFGYAAAEAIGQSIRLIVPADRNAEEDEVLRQIAAGQLVDHYETVRVAKDGGLINVSLTVSPIVTPAGEIVGASRNRAGHHRDETARAGRPAILRRSSTSSDDAIVSKDLDGIVVSWNRAAEKAVWLCSAEEMIGRSIRLDRARRSARRRRSRAEPLSAGRRGRSFRDASAAARTARWYRSR